MPQGVKTRKTVNGMGVDRPQRHFPLLLILSGGLLLAALVLFAIEIFHFTYKRDPTQPDITVAGIPINGMAMGDAISTWEQVYNQPVELDFQGSPILLIPSDINFRTDSQQMVADLKAKTPAASGFVQQFWGFLWRQPSSTVTIDLHADYEEAKLRTILSDIAVRYNPMADRVGIDSTVSTGGVGAVGMQLDIDGSIPVIDQALRRPTNRKVDLVLKRAAPHALDLSILKKSLVDFLNSRNFSPTGPDTLASIVLTDLQSGQEMAINPEVSYSAMSTIKIPILLNMFRTLKDAPNTDIKWLMGASILCSNNAASNALIRFSAASGSTVRDQMIAGLQEVNGTAAALGAKNTYISAPIDVGDKSLQFAIGKPKTSPDKTYDSKPDPYSQTTAQDMAVLLDELYDCSKYGSGIEAALPDGYTQDECTEMIELLSGNKIGRMIELGVPANTRVAHKNGWGGANGGYTSSDSAIVYTSSDSAIVYTPGGNYVLSIYMWEKLQPGYEVGQISTWATMEGLSRLIYNAFNPDQPMLQPRPPENLLTAADCVMPDPNHPEQLSLSNITNGRFDTNGNILPDACYNYKAYPLCDPVPQSRLSGGQGLNPDGSGGVDSAVSTDSAAGSGASPGDAATQDAATLDVSALSSDGGTAVVTPQITETSGPVETAIPLRKK